MPDHRRVFDGDRLRADLWLPGARPRTLYVTFRQRLPNPGAFSDDGPVQRALRQGLAHLHIQSRWNDWFLNDETTALEAALAPLRDGFSTALALGYSMGGYAALRLARALRLDQAIVISPQFTLDRAILPGERRYPEAKDYDSGLGDLATFARFDLAGVVIFDPHRPLDRRHADLIARTMPQMALARFAFGGHPATGVLRELGGFRDLQGISMSPDAGAASLVALHRGLRARSTHYWQNRAEACLKSGRPADAATATRRVRSLGG